MGTTRTIHRSFSGGELSEDLHARSDLEKYRTGLALMKNWVPTPQGAMYARSGTRYVADVRHPLEQDGPVLLPFIFNDTQSFVLELADNVLQFFTRGLPVMDGGAPYSIPTQYTRQQANEATYVQSNDVITFAHQSVRPQLLKRFADNNWVFENEVFAPVFAPPDAPRIVDQNTEANVGTPIDHSFVATRYDPISGNESLPSAVFTHSVDLTIKGNYIGISASNVPYVPGDVGSPLGFDPSVSEVRRYYKLESGLYGYIGEGEGAIIVRNIAPDLSRTPPRYDPQFETADRYPAAVGYWGQRKVFANTVKQPQTHWMTETGTESSLNYHMPGLATDSIQYTLAARQASQIKYVVDHGSLYLFSAGALWRAKALQDAVVAAGNLEYSIAARVGAADVRPIETENTVLFVSARGHTVRELNPSTQLDSPFAVRNLSILASHLFKEHKLIDSAMVDAPNPIALFLRDDGILLALAYMPEERITAWFRIDVGDPIGNIAVVPEGNHDELYLTVKRGGLWRVEQMNFKQVTDPAVDNRWHLDSCITYLGPETSTISGVIHLIGRPVMVVDGDGKAQGPFTVQAGGVVNLTTPVTRATVGLQYNAIAQALPASGAEVRSPGAKVMVNSAQVTVRDTTGLYFRNPKLGHFGSIEDPEFGVLESDYAQRHNGLLDVPIENEWNEDSDTSDLMIIQSAPQPAHVLGLIMNVTVGEGYG